jgi:hypothetical protein
VSGSRCRYRNSTCGRFESAGGLYHANQRPLGRVSAHTATARRGCVATAIGGGPVRRLHRDGSGAGTTLVAPPALWSGHTGLVDPPSILAAHGRLATPACRGEAPGACTVRRRAQSRRMTQNNAGHRGIAAELSAPLEMLRASPRNAVAVGDAENDHALLGPSDAFGDHALARELRSHERAYVSRSRRARCRSSWRPSRRGTSSRMRVTQCSRSSTEPPTATPVGPMSGRASRRSTIPPCEAGPTNGPSVEASHSRARSRLWRPCDCQKKRAVFERLDVVPEPLVQSEQPSRRQVERASFCPY